MTKFTLAILLSAISLSVIANPETTTDAVPQNLHIFSENGNAYLAGPEKACSYGKYILPGTHPRFKEIFSLLLAAQISKKQVKLRFDGCNNDDQGVIVGVYLTE